MEEVKRVLRFDLIFNVVLYLVCLVYILLMEL